MSETKNVVFEKSEIMNDIVNMKIHDLMDKYEDEYDRNLLCQVYDLLIEQELLESYQQQYSGYCIILMMFHIKISLGYTDANTVLAKISTRAFKSLHYFMRDSILAMNMDMGKNITPYYENYQIVYYPHKKK